jgi:8-oxo-dGTP pyrophosphatase MutT (NUDIX family)
MTPSGATSGAPLPDWWQALAARAALPPVRPRVALRLDGAPGAPVVGSIEPALAAQLRDARLPLRARDGAEFVTGHADEALARIARWLHDRGLSLRWRDELLAVTALDGAGAAPLARIERSAVRPLGITTRAVHLVAFTPLGRVWVQQRALDKATDPGQWDTLVGGLVAADESDAEALARESQEEADLRVADLRELSHVDRLTVRRPVSEGYMVEQIEVFEAVVPAHLEPRNEDGEVERFDCLVPDELVRLIADGRLTLEAALMLAGSLRRRGLV